MTLTESQFQCRTCEIPVIKGEGEAWFERCAKKHDYECKSCFCTRQASYIARRNGEKTLPSDSPVIEYEPYPVIEGLKDGEPKTVAPRTKNTEEGFVYLIPCPYGFRVTKIGWTQDLKQRLSQLQVGHHGLLQYAAYYKVCGEYVEVLCQDAFKTFHIRGEHYAQHSWEVVDTVEKICLQHSTSGRDSCSH